MKSNFQFWIFFIGLQCVEFSFAQGEFICPDHKDILPCTCHISRDRTRTKIVQCKGPVITQDDITNLFDVIREVNEVTIDEWLVLDELWIHSTNLTTLDLSPLMKSRMRELKILGNRNLQSIVGPPLNNNRALVEVTKLEITSSKLLTKDGFDNCLFYFSPKMNSFILQGINLNFGRRSGQGQEFITGISSLPNLLVLSLAQNNIRKIGGGQFRAFRKLKELRLWGNELKEIGENAFVFDYSSNSNSNRRKKSQRDEVLRIDLSNNELNENSFSKDSGLLTIDRKVQLDLDQNKFTLVPAEPFERFLDARGGNSVSFDENPIICSDNWNRMRWLKGRRAELEEVAKEINCSDEPGENIFTSIIQYNSQYSSSSSRVSALSLGILQTCLLIPIILYLERTLL